MSEEKNNNGWLASFLAGFGVPANWAKIIAGAIIGALAAAGVLTQEGCSVNYSQSADGASSFNSEFDPAGLTFEKDGNVSYQGKTIVVIPQKK